ncbi:gag protein, putative [Brugia malayi]|uniref:phosphoglycerate kinase n=1 Tax=Brugia malayi TaxID=6279 RepID=A0A4E9FFP9_BRUMA|nr:gag protein, putative [Brugia malayi]VIO95124.1 gag protein, putative [Brugia malayi]
MPVSVRILLMYCCFKPTPEFSPLLGFPSKFLRARYGYPIQNSLPQFRYSRWMDLDIGPETAKQFVEVVGRAKTIVWNGLASMFSREQQKL